MFNDKLAECELCEKEIVRKSFCPKDAIKFRICVQICRDKENKERKKRKKKKNRKETKTKVKIYSNENEKDCFQCKNSLNKQYIIIFV